MKAVSDERKIIAPQGRRFLSSRVVWVLCAFFLLNAIWAQSRFGVLNAADFPFYTWTACAIEDFLKKESGRANIVFLGSSLVLSPLGGVDADFLKRPLDAPRHHRSLYFEQSLFQKSGQSLRTFNFALPGEMPSDAYLITNFLCKKNKQPDLIIYGVGPRDFMDNLLPSPQATDPFQYLSRFGDYSAHIDTIAPDWQQRLNYELGRLIFCYGDRVDLSHNTERYITHGLDRFVPPVGKPLGIKFRRIILPEYHPFEVGLNECLFQPYTDKTRPPFVDNIAEYRKRYRQLKWDTFLSQMEFLSSTLDVARARGIRVILVSMPITDINRNLVGPFAADVYLKSLRVIAKAKGATVIDLDRSGQFKLQDFSDTVHLHSGGGAKMLDMLAEKLVAERVVKSIDTRSHSETSNLASRKESLL